MTRRIGVVVPVMVAVAVALAACGGSAGKSAEALIEGTLADDIGLGELEAECTDPPDLEVGDTFDCTATTEDGRVVELIGTLEEEDRFEVVTTNLLTADDVERLREIIAESIAGEIGEPVVAADITCPEGSVLLDAAGDLRCEIVDQGTGDVYELTITTGGLEPGVGPRDLGWQIGDQPIR